MESEKKANEKHRAQDVSCAGVVRAQEEKAPTGGGVRDCCRSPVLAGVGDSRIDA